MKPITFPALIALSLSVSASRAEPLLGDHALELWSIKGPEVCWTIKEGVLTGANDPEKKGSTIWTKKSYTNFTLTGEFRFSGKIDSGVFIRHEGDQIQIGVSSSLQRDMTGSPYISKLGKYPVEAKNVAERLKEGEWNFFTITAIGNHYTVELNGKQILDYRSDTAVKQGPIGLQVHGGIEMEIQFRDLDVEEMAD